MLQIRHCFTMLSDASVVYGTHTAFTIKIHFTIMEMFHIEFGLITLTTVNANVIYI